MLKNDSLWRPLREAESSHFAGERGEMHPIGMTAMFSVQDRYLPGSFRRESDGNSPKQFLQARENSPKCQKPHFSASAETVVERLVTIRCRFAEPIGEFPTSRWPARPQMREFHE